MRASRNIGVELMGCLTSHVSLLAADSSCLPFCATFGPEYMRGVTLFTLNGRLTDNTGRYGLIYTRKSEAVHPETGEMVEPGRPIYMVFGGEKND